MNKFLKIEILSRFISTFGFLIILLLLLFKYDLLAIVFLIFTIPLLIILIMLQIFYVSIFNKNYINNNGFNENLNDEINDEKIYKVIRYKKEFKTREICYIICSPFIIMDVFLAYYIFGEEIFNSNGSKVLIYIIIGFIFITQIISLVNSIKQIRILNSIDHDLKNKNFEIIRAKPIEITPLYYNSFGNRNKFKVCYGLEIQFDNNLKLTALIEFPFIGYRKMKKLIDENLMNQKYKLKYLKTSNIVIQLDSKIIDALK